jgi:phenylacetate-CoA ligase
MLSKHSSYNFKVNKLQKSGQKKALKAFKEASKRVPAYKHFLKHNSVNPKSIRSIKDFEKLPVITKDNYLRKYSLQDLMWDGDKFKGDIISVSSGSSGEPFFWLRDKSQHEEAADTYYELYKDIFQSDQKSTLLVVCFSMGIWIAGSYTTMGGMSANNRGLKLNVITPALGIIDSLAVIKRLKNDYEQIILAGYPPFLKDLIDRGTSEGINWSQMNIAFTAAGESIGEELRDYFVRNGTAYNDPTKMINIYGTVDAGIIAHESPLTIALRRTIKENQLQEKFFGRSVLPTLAQYDPRRKYIEIIDENIVFTSTTAIPLIRYDIQDSGGQFDSIREFATEGILESALSKYPIELNKWAKPFVYVHGRKDFTASLYAVLIYPENIKKALLSKASMQYVTGRFVMGTVHDAKLDQYLEIILELKESIKENQKIHNIIKKEITKTLVADNSEFKKLRSVIGKRAEPKIIFKKTNDSKFFSRNSNKQKWTNNQS